MKEFKLCDNPLYHGVKLDNVVKILEEEKLSARTTQRYWPDGLRRKDKDKQYQSSLVMKGWSTTRDFYFAGAWSDVVLVLDKDKIQQNFEIIPFSWNYSINGLTDHKKEREEFIVARKTGLTFDGLRDEYEKLQDEMYEKYSKTGDKSILKSFEYEDYFHYLKKPESKTIPLEHVKGFYISDDILKRFSKSEYLKTLIEHPLFKGTYDRKDVADKNKNNIESVRNMIARFNNNKKIKP